MARWSRIEQPSRLPARARNPLIADQEAVDWRKADLTDRQRAILGFAVKLAVEPAHVAKPDLDALRTHGLSEDDIWDVGAITAPFAMSNRLAHLSAMRTATTGYARCGYRRARDGRFDPKVRPRGPRRYLTHSPEEASTSADDTMTPRGWRYRKTMRRYGDRHVKAHNPTCGMK
jgi:hypothetical protein